MVFQVHFRSEIGEYSYLLACVRSREAIIIDPQRDSLEAYEQVLSNRDLDLRYTLRTGEAAESVAAADALRRRWRSSRVVPADSVVAGAVIRVGHGDLLCVGDIEIECLGRPGRPNRSLSYRVGDRVFTGAACIRSEEAILDLPPETLIHRSCEVRGSHFGLLALEAGASLFEREEWRAGEGARFGRALASEHTTQAPSLTRVA